MNEEYFKEMKELFRTIIEKNIEIEAYQWVLDKAALSAAPGNNYQLNVTFTSMPRRTGKQQIHISDTDTKNIREILPGLSINHWTVDRLCRVWLLMQLESSNKEVYVQRIENLFPQAEMNEQVALYSALPLFVYPEEWKLRCAEGIRSNINDVLEAIMYYNPYPAKFLEEPAWNQLVMKAFFTGKNVNNITGIDARVNQNLASMLFDYVEERWSAHRSEDPQIWRLTGKYLDEAHIYMMEKIFKEGSAEQKESAALACADSSFEKAKQLLDQYPGFKNDIQQNILNWNVVAAKE